MRNNQIKGLYLNFVKKFKCTNFDFLYDLPELELLNIIYTPVDNLKSVESLVNLKFLSLSCHWKSKVNFCGLNNLIRCFISYGKGAESVFECSSLRCLYIDGFKIKDYSRLTNLAKIEYLTVGNSSFNSPELFSQLLCIHKLVLLNCRKLDHLDGIGKLEHLEWLIIDGSRKLSNIEELSILKSIKVLQLSNNGEIKTLLPIKVLVQLKALSFYGDTKILDGDFSFLEAFSSLSLVGFAGRRHYTHKPIETWDWNDYESGKVAVIRK